MSLLVSRSPATGEVLGEVEATDPREVPGIVARARAAQAAWGALSPTLRRAHLARAIPRFEAEAGALAALIAREMGKPLRDAKGEVAAITGMDTALRELEEALAPELLARGGARSTVYRDPLGVAAAITPWNFPLMMPHWMVLPALMAGNAVVLKPSEEAPLTGRAYAEVLSEVLPEGTLTVIQGADEVGAALVAAEVDLIAFTGSREVGKEILSVASRRLTRVVLELGGKDPLLVLEGADVEKAARFAASNSFRNAGQVCVSTERIYVERAIAEDFVAALIEEASEWVVGDPFDRETRVGPMVSARQRARVLAQLEDAVARGAKVVFEGQAPPGEAYLAPRVLTEVRAEMALMREETFGPVAAVAVVDDTEAAVRAANDSPFALGASVFGPEEDAAAVARRLTAGMIGVNRGSGGVAGTPWVGARESGYGYHSSRDGHRQFAQTRVVTV